jgi:hypothetical protein
MLQRIDCLHFRKFAVWQAETPPDSSSLFTQLYSCFDNEFQKTYCLLKLHQG